MSRKQSNSHPEGLVLYDKFTVGRKLGEGAQCSGIHAVVDPTGRETEQVVKLAKLPHKKLAKGKCAKQSAEVTLLRGERRRYKSFFNGGKIVPLIPKGHDAQKAFEGTTDGYEYMIMEKMDKPLWDCIDEIIAESGNAKQVDLSQLAQQFLILSKAVHNKNHLIVDNKPENFMFANRTNPQQTHADLLRLIDLGLWGLRHHPVNVKVSALTGNAMYCSLNMQDMNTPTLGDDAQMMVIVIAELVIRIHAKLHGTADEYEKTTIPSYLPWSQGTSDTAVFKSKEKNLLDCNSEFYKRMPATCAATIFKLIGMTQAIPFNRMPDYAALAAELKSFAVPKPAKRKGVASGAKKASVTRSNRASASPKDSIPGTPQSQRATRAGSSSAAKRRPSSSTQGSNDTEDKEDSKPSSRKKRTLQKDDPMEVDLVELSDEEEQFPSDEDDTVEPMDVEPVADEQENQSNGRNKSVRAKKKTPAAAQTTAAKERLLVIVKRGKEELYQFDANIGETFVFGTGKANNFKNKIRKTIPAGEGNHCSFKVVPMAKKSGQTEADRILNVEIEHLSKKGTTQLGKETLGPEKKKAFVSSLHIPQGKVETRCQITVGDVTVTFQKA